MLKTLRTLLLASLAAVLSLGLAAPSAADDDDDDDEKGGVARFVTLPKDGPGFPEGIAADAAGNIYVATFDFLQPNVVYVFARSGKLTSTIPLPGVFPLGLAFDAGGDLFVADFISGNVLRFAPPFTAASSLVATYSICGGVTVACALNAITFDAAGNLYVSDSFGGRVFKLALPAATVSTLVSDESLKAGPFGFPPFGANGLAFDAAGANLYIAHTAHDRIVKHEMASGMLITFAESINGADGIVFDEAGRLWVAANQADEVVALNAVGRVVERRGRFQGIRKDGSPKGLLFPASLALSRGSLYVTNLALPLTTPAGDEPEEDVRAFTVSRIKIGER